MVHGLDHVRVKAGLLRSMAIFFLPPPGQRHEYEALTPGLPTEVAAHFIAIHDRQTDVEQDGIGTETLGGLDRRASIVRYVCFMAGELKQHGQRFGTVFAVVDDQDAAAHGRRTRAGGWRLDRLQRSGEDGNANGELTAATKTLTVRDDCSTMHFDQGLHQCQPDAEAIP